MVSKLYRKYKHIKDNLSLIEQKYFDDVVNKELEELEYENSLGNLCQYLFDYYNKQVVILIDEYDVPITAGFYYDYFIICVYYEVLQNPGTVKPIKIWCTLRRNRD